MQALRFKVMGSPEIILTILRDRMLPPIRFHDQLRLMTIEIEDVTPHRHLPAELEASKPPISQQRPETLLGISGMRPHLASEVDQMLGSWRLASWLLVFLVHQRLSQFPLTPALSRRERGQEHHRLFHIS